MPGFWKPVGLGMGKAAAPLLVEIPAKTEIAAAPGEQERLVGKRGPSQSHGEGAGAPPLRGLRAPGGGGHHLALRPPLPGARPGPE